MFHVQYGAINALLTAFSGTDTPVEIEWFGSFLPHFAPTSSPIHGLDFPL